MRWRTDRVTKVFKEFLDGSLLVNNTISKQLPSILLATVLMFFYIANRYHAEKVALETAQIQNELKELRSEMITVRSEIMNMSRNSEIKRWIKIHNLGLQEPATPAKEIVVKTGK